MSGIDGAEIVGPIETLGGKKHAQVQIFCGEFEFDEPSRADFERLIAKQSSFRDRLGQLKIERSLVAEYDRRAKKKSEKNKALAVTKLKKSHQTEEGE